MEFTDTYIHEHKLTLTDDDEKRRIRLCNACHEEIPGGAFYSCSYLCSFVIHKSCAELPREFQNPHHPHPLTLLTETIREGCVGFSCFSCDKYRQGYSFHCGECKFDLDIKCALWKPTTDEGQDQLHHSSHLHPLVAVEKKKQKQQHDKDDEDVCCKMCKDPCSDDAPAYACDPCNFYLHRSCAVMQLPPTLQYFNHPCPLTLCLKIKQFICGVCADWDKFCSYLCKPCGFQVEMRCALLTVQGQQQFKHVGHRHPLQLTEMKHDDGILCSACAKHCSGQTYICCMRKCNFFLHDSCFNLPRKIHHPFHPFHPLILSRTLDQKECKICYRFCPDVAYFCHHCESYMHVQCPVMVSSIKYQGHPHNILFVDGLNPFETHADDGPTQTKEKPVLLCSACGTIFERSIAMFHCAECDFHLHFKCGPLPRLIKLEDHKCSDLELTDSPVIIEKEDQDDDDLYCDICQKKRNPRLPVYYCWHGCHHLVGIKCVIIEVLRSLYGEYEEVELRSIIFKHQTGKVISKGMVKGIELPHDQDGAGGVIDIKRFNDFQDICKEKYWYALWNIINFQKTISNARFTDENVFSYCDEDYNNFMTWIHSVSSRDREELERSLRMNIGDVTPFLARLWGNVTGGQIRMLEDLEKDKPPAIRNIFTIFNVGNHLVIPELATILEDLCAKYGDIVPKSADLSSRETTFFISSLCETIRGMCTTRIVDISEEKLVSWWRCLSALQLQGFEVKFAFDRLKRVADAYYVLQVEKTVKEDDERVGRRIEEISQQIKKLEAEQTTLEEERCKRRETSKPASSSKVAECFKEKSVLKWMIAGEGLL